jgi:hypothetical protein
MTKGHFNSSTNEGISNRGVHFHIAREADRDEPDNTRFEYNIHPVSGPVISRDTLKEAVERAMEL